MLSVTSFLADSLGPTGAPVIAAICFLVGLWFSLAVLSAGVRARMRWRLRGPGTGPEMSRLGAGGVALTAYLFSVLSFAYAFEWRAAAHFIFYALMAAIFLTTVAAFRDYARASKRI
jgi:hypothetical protein